MQRYISYQVSENGVFPLSAVGGISKVRLNFCGLENKEFAYEANEKSCFVRKKYAKSVTRNPKIVLLSRGQKLTISRI